MIQIIGFLLCIYLVFKGVEILQIGISSTAESKLPVLLGAISFIASLVVAGLFAYWLIAAGESMNRLPPEAPFPIRPQY